MTQIIDTYQNYEELSAHERKGIDYQILHKRKGDQLLVLSPHAGGIESGVSELIHELASDYSMYLFEGLKVKGNHVLHITSTRFDEPICLSQVRTHHYTFALHGYAETDVLQSLVGGTDRERAAETVERLTLNGFPALLLSESDRFSGTHPHNINNQCLTGQSVQIEISQAQRRAFFQDFRRSYRRDTQNEQFYRYTNVLKQVLRLYE
ncbi:poly-gamma-glutamate hydrolase family protein [Bacillus sp. 28A-2]|uniref:poly-gamma-glutamate hydrolase family protein n=1 Tax=Bacillus sp. 28A-2 TaxID=2772252 RepID=UPI00168D0599|nr:poly-gamma-glutamate hydrolase family protein [Bacillus sp. 28A-2]MBD3859698.1 poly-gamma-glutamate hydrolase family protein [Bacillus sp. 28A-2]